MADNKDFTAKVEAWVRDSKALFGGVFRESAQRVTDVMTTPRDQGGNLPVDTGYLWHSAQASTSAPPQIDPASKGRERTGEETGPIYSLDSGPIALVINGADVGDTIFICFTASYAGIANSRAMFVDLAAQQWPQIVETVVGELKGRMGG